MMKKLCVVLFVVLGVSFMTCSANDGDNDRNSPFNELGNMAIIPQEYQNINLKQEIKRTEALEILLIVAEEDTNVMERIQKDHKNQEMLRWKYIDVLDNTKECAISVEASSIGLMQGEYAANGEERIARMEDSLTWEECLYFSLRILSKGYGLAYERVNDALSVYKSVNPNEEPLLMMAEDCGLINQDNIAYSSAVWVTADMLDQTVTWGEFSEIIYKMLYIPTEIHGYGGTYDHYRIESFR